MVASVCSANVVSEFRVCVSEWIVLLGLKGNGRLSL